MLHFVKIAMYKIQSFTVAHVRTFWFIRLIGKFATGSSKAKHLIVTSKLRRNALLKNGFALMLIVGLTKCAMLGMSATKKLVHQEIKSASVTQMITSALILPPQAIKSSQKRKQ